MFNRSNVFFREAIYNPAPWHPAAQWIEEPISIPPKLPSGERCVHGLPQCRHSHKTDDYGQEMLLKGDRALLRRPSVVHRRFAEKPDGGICHYWIAYGMQKHRKAFGKRMYLSGLRKKRKSWEIFQIL